MGAIVVADLVEIAQPDCIALAAPNRHAKMLSKCLRSIERAAIIPLTSLAKR